MVRKKKVEKTFFKENIIRKKIFGSRVDYALKKLLASYDINLKMIASNFFFESMIASKQLCTIIIILKIFILPIERKRERVFILLTIFIHYFDFYLPIKSIA